MFIINKTFTFQAGHRLVNGYVGPCANLHGHSYQVSVELSSVELDQYSMVKDFNELKPLKIWLDENFDHALLLCVSDRKVIEFCQGMHFKTYIFDDNPTCEIIAKEIYETIKQDEELGQFIQSVMVVETETSMAIYMEENNGGYDN